ncbi:PR domain zinc finger protein 10-like [Spodoptera frugiperda]|uniref:PR domain zinc finger protein 10-like n=1 Tax=Spodoptera frugiperda TaxID=7108 RepID=A0A9R0F6F5_SPOFR|nr:PR domain zinc finger protein 10-like [Spodoptera frugiperda]XP_050562048.1 PR domain zinc finger protein 10-like [Spodoptera frugiperda]
MAEMNNTDPQAPCGPTHLYLLQMDSSINLSLNEQVLPLHLLDNSLEYGHKQYLLPIPLKQKDASDQLEVLIDSSHGQAKIMGVIDRAYKSAPNHLPICDDQLQTVSVVGGSNLALKTEHLPDLNGTPLNLSIEETGLNNKVDFDNKIHKTVNNYVHISDRVVPPRAYAVLPAVLQVQRHHIISTRRSLPACARFGPVQGIRNKISQSEAVELVLNATSNKIPLFLVRDMEGNIIHIDTTDKDKSNWIGLLPLGDQNSANVWLYEENQELFAITTETVPLRKPLILGYSKQYADDYGLIGPTKEIRKETQVEKTWWCYECQRTLPSEKQLKSHTETYHKDGALLPRRRYRCRHCTRTFSRLFALRRHTLLHCPVKIERRNKVTNQDTQNDEPQTNINISINSEDNRIPSDESFQNYSNGLDFSTNLFDTDRISNLDISGNTRSDNDFNPYAIGYKDDNDLANDLDFSCKLENCQRTSKEKSPQPEEQLIVPCPYCKEIIVKGNRRQHISKCPARVMTCECKKVFRNMKQFKEHIWSQHSNEKPVQSESVNNVPDVPEIKPEGPPLYKCEQCQHTFKRRGMLVNHLWKIHNMISARVPLERRVRHYPCGTCTKLYRTAAKRDRHVQLHHPGAAKFRVEALDGGTRVCEPAMCSECPRQYVTRAKLLQHQRAHHPYLIPPPTTKKGKSLLMEQAV